MTLPHPANEWVREALGTPPPDEGRATCQDCAMCGSQVVHATQLRFNPEVKCCTYWPTLANYQVGGILDAARVGTTHVEGAQRLEMMLQKSWAQPVGIGAAPTQKILYAAAKGSEFGRSVSLRCPYYQQGDNCNCTIWGHRNAVCSTWFCKYEKGVIGRAFWDSLRILLTSVERTLSAWCALQLGIAACAIRQSAESLTRSDLERQSLDGHSRDGSGNLWANWNDRRREYFLQCFDLVRGLTLEEVKVIGGSEIECRLQEVHDALRRSEATTVPDRLTVGRLQIVGLDGNSFLVTSAIYTSNDPQTVDAPLLHAIHECHDEPAGKACTRIQEATGTERSDQLVRHLYEFGLLV